MKVLYIANGGIGGANQSLLSSIKYLKSYGVVPEVIVPSDYAANIFLAECNVHVVKNRYHLWPSTKGAFNLVLFFPRLLVYAVENFIASKKIINICKKFSPDIIHTNIGVSELGYKISKKLHIPHLWHIREYGYENFAFFPTRNSHIAKLNDSYTITVTKSLAAFFSLKHNKAIYDGVYSAHYAADFRPKQHYFLYVGQISAGKGTDCLINAFVKFCRTDSKYKLFLAGQGSEQYVNHLKDVVECNGLSDRIIFLGQRNDVASLMAEAKALVVPSLVEGLGRITIEAMFNNCLVIGRDNTGTKEQFDNGLIVAQKEIGFRFNEEADLLDNLSKVANMSDGQIKNMTDLAHNVVYKFYTLEENALETYNYYLEIISKESV